MSYGTLPMNFGGQNNVEGVPTLVLVSTISSSSPDKTLYIQSLQAYQYFVYNIQGHFVASAVTPDGQGKRTTAIPLSQLTYPTYITLDIYDLGSGLNLQSLRFQVIGADTYNITLTFPPHFPIANGAIDIAMQGEHIMVYPDQIPTLIWQEGDVSVRT